MHFGIRVFIRHSAFSFGVQHVHLAFAIFIRHSGILLRIFAQRQLTNCNTTNLLDRQKLSRSAENRLSVWQLDRSPSRGHRSEFLGFPPI